MPQFVKKIFFATVRVCLCNININNFLIFFLTEMFKIKLLAFSLHTFAATVGYLWQSAY